MTYEGSMNFSSIIKRYSEENPNKVVIKYNDEKLTYKDLNQRVNILAKGLKSLGIKKGDKIGILLYNCPEFFEIIFAVNRLGAIFVPLNYRLVSEELAYILENAEAKAIFTEEAFHEKVNEIREELKELEHYISLSDKDSVSWIHYQKLLKSKYTGEIIDTEIEFYDMHRLMYTSGTTSRPKGVEITYENLYWKNIGHIWTFEIQSEDKTLIVGPLYHVGGLDLPATGTLYRGGSIVILRRFDSEEVLRTIDKEKPTNVWLSPAMLNMILEYIDQSEKKFNLDSIRFIIGGGENMPEVLVKKVNNLFKNAWFCDAYGLTETLSGDTFLPQSKTFKKIGSVGKPCIHLDLKIVSDNGETLKEEEVGEIALRGPKVAKRYWKNEKATKEAFKLGWFHTGDMGYLDPDGYLYITDRKKDMIISGGENIGSLEIEQIIHEYPNILETAVIAVPHEKWGEVPKAYIVTKKGYEVSKIEVLKFCKERLAKYKVPKEIEFIKELPRNPSGKVLKKELKNKE